MVCLNKNLEPFCVQVNRVRKMNTICKMRVSQTKDVKAWSSKEQKEVDAKEMQAVAIYDPDPQSENGKFFTSTPSAFLNFTAINKDALEGVEAGDEIYVNITIAKKRNA